MLKVSSGHWRPVLGFEFGSFGPLWVREECFHWGLPRPCSLLYASDLHLGHWWTRPVPAQVLKAVDRLRPDVVLLGGDLVDVPSALTEFQRFVAALGKLTIVAGIPGNHDVAALRDALRAGGGHWLPDEPLRAPVGVDATIQTGPGRADVLCAHYPSDFPRAERAGYRLMLAGHLHGGQCVLATVSGRQVPAVWFHCWHGLRFDVGQSTMLVSRGLGDTFPFRFNCPREMLLCRLD
jgi:predicted MPP superfamily phosphohydrolase